MAILGLTLNKVFYQKKRGSEHFSATLPRILKEWKFPVPHAPERMEVPSPTRPLKGWKFPVPHALKGQKLLVPHALKGWKLLDPHALKGQKLLAQGIALGMLYASLSP